MSYFDALAGTLATNLGKGLLQGLKQSVKDLNGNSSLLNSFGTLVNSGVTDTKKSETINLTDLNLTPGELNRILKLREAAMAQGSGEITFNLQGENYSMNLESFDMKVV